MYIYLASTFLVEFFFILTDFRYLFIYLSSSANASVKNLMINFYYLATFLLLIHDYSLKIALKKTKLRVTK